MRLRIPSAKMLAGAALASAIAAAGLPAAADVESQDPIKLTLNDWTSELITTRMMGEVLARAGYNVEYVQADYLAQFAGLKTGDLTLAMEVWQTTAGEALDTAEAEGGVERLGELGAMAIEEWWYPSYMAELCPGLPNWEALKSEECAEAFSTAETSPAGRYLSGPVTWGGYDEERVEALGIPFEVVRAGTDAALFAELESAYQRKAPIILWVYSPHWAPAKYEGAWVEFPPYEAACYEDPSWGSNPDMAYDCGKPRGPIWKAAWAGMAEKWPGAHAIAKRFQLSGEELGALAGKVDLDGMTVEAVVAEWMAANDDRVKAWLGQ